MGEFALAGGGYVAVTVAISDRLQVTGDKKPMTHDGFSFKIFFVSDFFVKLVPLSSHRENFSVSVCGFLTNLNCRSWSSDYVRNV